MTRKQLITGTILGGLVGGVTLGSVLRTVQAGPGPGDPPVIVLPSAKSVAKAPIRQVQATEPAKTPVVPTLEILPLPATQEPPRAAPVAPPLLIAPVTPTVKADALPAAGTEKAPAPRNDSAPPVEVLPTPSTVATPGDTQMKISPAVLVPLMAAAPLQAETKPVMEKITDYAKTDDVKSLKDEVESLRKQLATLAGATDVKALKDEITALKKQLATPADVAKGADVKALKDEIAALKKDLAVPADAAKGADVKALKDEIAKLKTDIAGTVPFDPARGVDVKALKDEIAKLKTDIAMLSVKPADHTTMKAELDTLRKDVSTLNTFLREAIDGKVDKGFTHDGVVKRLQKLDESIDGLSKKVAGLDTRMDSRSTSAYTAKPPEAIGPNQGTVSVVNAYPIEIAIVINGVSHRLDPHTSRNVFVPQGVFKYQLLTSGGAETERAIKENETVTLTIK